MGERAWGKKRAKQNFQTERSKRVSQAILRAVTYLPRSTYTVLPSLASLLFFGLVALKIRQVVFLSYHSQAFFEGVDIVRRSYHDFIWNAGLAGVVVQKPAVLYGRFCVLSQPSTCQKPAARAARPRLRTTGRTSARAARPSSVDARRYTKCGGSKRRL